MDINKKQEHHALCDCVSIHGDIVEQTRDAMPEIERIFDIAEFFKMLGDSTRINILYALSKNELCVCDISSLLNMTQSAVSHQLRLLKQARLVRFRREGKIVYYALDDNHIASILDMGSEHVAERE